MATIEHNVITEANLHQCKGVSTAPGGAFQRSKGDGTGEWVETHGLWCYKENPISFTSGVWTDISWDGTLISSGVTRSGATLTIARSGVYILSYAIMAASPAKAEARVLKNGSELVGSARGIEGTATMFNIPIQATFGAALTAGDTLKLQFYIHSPASGTIAYIPGGVATNRGLAQLYVYTLPS